MYITGQSEEEKKERKRLRNRKYMREYRQRDGYKKHMNEYHRQYRKTPEGLAKRREWARANHDPEKARERALWSNYEMTLKEYDTLLAKQNFRCAICVKPGTKTRFGGFHVDHNHETGVVRGLLCGPCNVGIGQFREKPKILAAAIAYLKEHTDE